MDNREDGTVPVLIYGIVTNALQWVFFRWGGSLDNPAVEVSPIISCTLDGEINPKVEEEVKQITQYIISILQSQVRGLDNATARHRMKRPRH